MAVVRPCQSEAFRWLSSRNGRLLEDRARQEGVTLSECSPRAAKSTASSGWISSGTHILERHGGISVVPDEGALTCQFRSLHSFVR